MNSSFLAATTLNESLGNIIVKIQELMNSFWIRKYNGSFIPATQNIADWNANEELRGKTSAILKNSKNTINGSTR